MNSRHHFAQLCALFPALADKRLLSLSHSDTLDLAERSGLHLWQVRLALYRHRFNRTWHLRMILDPDSGATPEMRHKALILMQARQADKALKQLTPPGFFDKPKPVRQSPPKPFPRAAKQNAQRLLLHRYVF